MRFPFQERQFSLCKSIHFFSGFRAISITQPKGQIPLKLNFASPGKVSVRALFWVPWVPNSLWLCLRDFRHRRTWIRQSADFCRPAADKKGHVDMFFSIVIFVSGIKSDWPLDFLWFTNCVIPWKQNLQQKRQGLIVVFSLRKHPFLLVIRSQRRRARRNGCFRRLCRVGNYIQNREGMCYPTS